MDLHVRCDSSSILSDKVVGLRVRLSSTFLCCVFAREQIRVRSEKEGGAIAVRTTENWTAEEYLYGMCLFVGWNGKDINVVYKRAYDC